MGNTLQAEEPKVRTIPYQNDLPAFEETFGFENGRKKREMIATEEEMRSAKLEFYQRDYCAHLAIKLLACNRDVFPLLYKCTPEKHEYLHCEYEDHLIRMKEFERDKRLRERQKRILANEAKCV